MITVFPAIDLMNKKCVRLVEGDFLRKKEYSDDPLAVAMDFDSRGFEWLHLVDLDGARSGSPKNFEVIESILRGVNLRVQVGGGIRDFETAERYLKIGASRVVLGSAAVKDRDFLLKCLDAFGSDKLVLALDVRGEEVAVSGWRDLSGISIFDFLRDFSGKNVLVTDISRDGMLEGPNFEIYKKLLVAFPGVNFIASGGVSALGDIEKLEEIGVLEVIVGKAIYEGRIKFDDLCKS